MAKPRLCKNTLCKAELSPERLAERAFYCNGVCRKREKSRRHSKRKRAHRRAAHA